MKSPGKSLAISTLLVLGIGLFLAWNLGRFGPLGEPTDFALSSEPSAEAKFPGIHQTFSNLKAEIAQIVAGRGLETNPFYTDYFVPPPPPPPEPAPPPPPPPP